MPIRKKIEELTIDPQNFDADAIKKALLDELTEDETAWRAAITQRDDTITKTSADLQKAQAKAWELSQQAPANTNDSPDDDKPDENSMEALRSRVFTTVERK